MPDRRCVRASALRRVTAILAAGALLCTAGCSGGGSGGAQAAATTVSAPAATTTTAAIAATTTAAAPAAAAPAAVAPVSWRPCAGGTECATYEVPLDRSKPGGGTVGLALRRVRARDQAQRIGTIFMNPGGPGGSGVDLLPFMAGKLGAQVRNRFDVVGFDPRGVAASDPVRCLDDAAFERYLNLEPAPRDSAAEEVLVRETKALVAACQARSGPLLPEIGTLEVVEDLDHLRQAVGDEKLTYIGFSYGTYIGALYADRHPDRVRAMVLDGAVDPTEDVMEGAEGQAGGFQRALEAFLADCRGRTSCPWNPAGGATEANLVALVDRLRANPPRVGGRTLGPGLVFYGLATPLYDKGRWPTLASGLATAEKGDGATLLALADALTGRGRDGYDNSLPANLAVTCRDHPGTRDIATIRAAADRLRATSPIFGPPLAWGAVACALWPVDAERPADPVIAAGAPPIVVLGTTNDPATPYESAQALASQLRSGVLVTVVGEGHTAYGNGTCADAPINTYLIDLTPPQRGLRCGG